MFKAWNTLKEENGRDPSLTEMARELDLSPRQVKAIMDTLSAATGVDSLTTSINDENEITLEDVLSDDGKGNPHDVFLRSENISVLQQSLLDLNERDREIVSLRFGLVDNEPKTLGEVAEKMGLSRERVRQIEERAVQHLRKAAHKAGLLEGEQLLNKHTPKGAAPTSHQNTLLNKVLDRGPLIRLWRRQATQEKTSAKKSRKTTTKKATQKKATGKKSASPKKRVAKHKKKK